MESDQFTNLAKQEKISSRLWFKYVPYWPLFLLFLLIGIGIAWFYLRYTPSVYEANASIIIKDSKKGIEDAKMIGEMNQLAAPTIVENEMDVLKSRALMRQVVKNLALYAPVFEDTKFRPSSAYTSSPIKIEIKNPDTLTEIGKVYFEYDQQKNQVIIDSQSYPLSKWITTPYGILHFAINNLKNPIPSPLYFSLVNPKIVAMDLISKLDISSNKLSSVVSLKIRDESAHRCEDIINELIRVYNLAAVNDKNILASNTLTFVEERLKYVSKDLQSIELQLQRYKTSKGAINIGEQGKLFLENVSTNDQKLSDVNMKLAVLNQVEKYISSKDRSAGLVPATLGVDDPLLSSLLNKLYDSELQYEKLKQTTGENNPQIRAVVNQIERIRPNILENIQSQRQSLEANKRNLFSTNSNYSSVLQSLPKQERNLVEISREQNNKSSIYNYLLQKREEAALSHSVVADTRLIDKAESTFQPVSPKKRLTYILAVGLAIGSGIIIISARDLFNRTVMFRHEIEEMTSFPIIGEIAMNKKKTGLLIEKGNATFLTEQFRKVRTSLDFIGIGVKRKNVLITSSISGEGKSFVTANLGLSLAMSGKKVAILEFDLSNPTLASKFKFESKKGIVDFLTGDMEIEEIIKRTSAHENLFLIPAGTLHDDPSDLLTSTRVKELFYYVDNIFDCVLVDTAPVGVLSDGYVLSKYCDATLFVVRHKYTPKVMLERLDENNKVNKLKNIAVIFNGVSRRGFGKAYGYGYGYAYTDKKRHDKKNRLTYMG